MKKSGCDAKEDAEHELSWKSAVKAASQWLGSLDLPNNLQGQAIDLSEQAKVLPLEGEFRRMVLEAARRELRTRGVKSVKLE